MIAVFAHGEGNGLIVLLLLLGFAFFAGFAIGRLLTRKETREARKEWAAIRAQNEKFDREQAALMVELKRGAITACDAHRKGSPSALRGRRFPT